jgi:hypothetical protein
MVNDLSDEHIESRWNSEIPVVLNSLKKFLVIILGESGVAARLKEGVNLGIKIDDVLIGPL